MRQSKASLQRAQARIKTQADQLQLDQVLNPGMGPTQTTTL